MLLLTNVIYLNVEPQKELEFKPDFSQDKFKLTFPNKKNINEISVKASKSIITNSVSVNQSKKKFSMRDTPKNPRNIRIFLI